VSVLSSFKKIFGLWAKWKRSVHGRKLLAQRGYTHRNHNHSEVRADVAI
jgi:hypothetical protein